MGSSRKELLAGAILLTIISCFFLEILISGYRNNITSEFPKLSLLATNLIGWYLSLFSIGTIIFAIYLVIKSKSKMGEFYKKFSVRAVIPGPFFLAIIPIGMGFLLYAFTQNINWGGYLACLSFPTIAVLLIITLKVPYK